MYRRLLLVVVCLLSAALIAPTYAQFKDPEWSFGIGGGGLLGQTQGTTSTGSTVKSKFQVGGQAYTRYGFAKYLQGELNVGLGQLAGQDATSPYKTSMIPLSLRLVYSPWELESVNPYVYGGFGATYFKGQSVAGGPALGDTPKSKAFAAFIPAGLGFQVRLNDHFSVEANAGFNYTFNDNIDYYFKSGGGGKDAFWTGLIGLTYTTESGGADPDNDGLANSMEKQFGTNPKKADTDVDGLSDGDEVLKYHTNPLKADSDGDGLTDADEVLKYHTNPLKADSDGDGLTDGDEIVRYKTDPLKSDSDSDGLTDGDEITKYHTDPLKSDSDNDGLTDADEILKYKTDPMNADSDGDNLTDGDEISRYKTDPQKADTDGGTVNDGAEIARGTNPLDPTDDVPKVRKAIVLTGVTFKTGKAELTPESAVRLDEVYNTLVENPEMQVEISGHTDNRGKRAVNIKLSLARANAVKTYMVSKGIASNRIVTKGYGPDKPIAPNTTEEGRANNRRIEFLRIK